VSSDSGELSCPNPPSSAVYKGRVAAFGKAWKILIGNQPCNTSHLTHVHTVGSCTSLLLNHTDRLAGRFYLDAHYGPAPWRKLPCVSRAPLKLDICSAPRVPLCSFAVLGHTRHSNACADRSCRQFGLDENPRCTGSIGNGAAVRRAQLNFFSILTVYKCNWNPA
jgi:hypothetical protein